MHDTFEQYLNNLDIEAPKSSKKEISATLSIINKKEFSNYTKKRSGKKWVRFAAVGIAACIAFVLLGFPTVMRVPNSSSGNLLSSENIMIKVLNAQVVQAGDWIYYSNPADNYSLYKINENAGGLIKLSDDRNIRIIDIKGDWIFYTCDKEKITEFVKIKTDGGSRTKLYQTYSTYLSGFHVEIIDDYIYIIDDGIYKIQIDDKKLVPIDTAVNIVTYTIEDDWIFYVEKDDDTDEAGFYKIRTDGSEKAFLCSAGEFSLWDFIGVSGGWIIMSEGQEIYRISMDGKSKETIYTFDGVYGGHMILGLIDDCIYFKDAVEEMDGALRDELFRLNISKGEKTFITDDAEELLIDGEWIYYTTGASGGSLNRIKTDGTRKQRMADGYCSGLYLVDDELYYTKEDGFYKISKDGTGEEKVALLNKLLP